ncbi:MAG: permease-like cell division protein FtsX [Oscillospiraceae bacterium]|nr:permease-like cell division protein FtsX [Oscillospiraceae bacterium]
MKGSNFSYLVKQGVVSVWHNRMMSFASFCILMVSLLFICLAVLFSLDIGIIIGNIEDTNQIIVFVEKETPEPELAHIRDVLDSFDYTASVDYITPDKAWEMMQDEFNESIAGVFDAIDEHMMPHTFTVSLNDITKTAEAAERFRIINYVEKVNTPFDFVNFLISIRTTFTVIGIAILIALVAVCIVIIYNTARTSVFARRTHISIMKHVGATNAFIRFPFFIEGMFIGVIAGAVSWYLTKITYESVVTLFASDIMLLDVLGINNIIGFYEINWLVLGANCLAGAFLGAVGTVFSMGKHLKV